MTVRIRRIDFIKGFGSFTNWTREQELPDFARYNLIYGWNGSGKTTLSRLLRSIETGRSHDIADDETMAYQLTLTDGRTIDSNSVQQLGGVLRVFNQDYVSDNLRFDEGAQTSPLLVLGQERLLLADEIAAAGARVQELNEQIDDRRKMRDRAETDRLERLADEARVIKQSLSKSATDDYANYNQARLKTTLKKLSDGVVGLLSDADEKGERVHLNATRLGTIAMPSPVDVVAMSETVSEALGRLSEPVRGSESAGWTDDADLARWLAQGVELHPSDTESCLFCTSSIPTGRLTELHERFSREYRESVRGLESSRKALSSWRAKIAGFEDRIADIDQSNLYEHLRDDWKAASRELTLVAECLGEALQVLVSAVDEKLDSSDEASDPQISFDSIVATIDLFAECQRSVLGLLETNLGEAAKIDGNRKRAQQRLERHACSRFREGHLLRTNEVRRMTSKIRELEDELEKARMTIKDLERKASSQAEACERLNKAISLYFGDGFLTAEPLVVDGEDVGLQLRRSGAVATHLSEGERKGIAIAYFLIEVNDATERGERLIVVLDDPVSSLDDNGLFQAEALVRRLGVSAAQLFVLTHNFTFFRRVRRWMTSGRRHKKAQLLYLTTRDAGGTRMPHLRDLPELLRNHESDYQYLFSVVGAAAEQLDPVLPEAELAQAPNASRRVLETFLGFRCPNSTDFKGGLKELKKQQSEVFSDIDVDALAAFLDEGSHDQSLDTASTSLLASYLDRRRYADVMRIVQRADPQHYSAMIKMCLKNGFSDAQTERAESDES